MMLVKAGKAVDEFIEHLLPLSNRATSSLTAAIRCSTTPTAA
jgi:hypothetical protein